MLAFGERFLGVPLPRGGACEAQRLWGEGAGGRCLGTSEEFLQLTYNNKFFKVTCAGLLRHVVVGRSLSHRTDLQHSTTYGEKGKGFRQQENVDAACLTQLCRN